jgi:hypothetical protein
MTFSRASSTASSVTLQSATMPIGYFTASIQWQRRNAVASFQIIFSKSRVRDRTDNNAIAGYVTLM